MLIQKKVIFLSILFVVSKTNTQWHQIEVKNETQNTYLVEFNVKKNDDVGFRQSYTRLKSVPSETALTFNIATISKEESVIRFSVFRYDEPSMFVCSDEFKHPFASKISLKAGLINSVYYVEVVSNFASRFLDQYNQPGDESAF